MSLTRPILLEELKKILSRLRRRVNNAGQIAVLTGRAENVITEALARNDHEAIEKVGDVVVGLDARLPTAPTNETQLNSEEALIEEGIQIINAIGDAPSSLSELEEARRKDKNDRMEAQRVQRENLIDRERVTVQVFCMHCPDAEPVTMTGVIWSYGDVVWRTLLKEPKQHHCRMENSNLVPEVWIRRDRVHPWGDGRRWTYVNLGDDVDQSTTELDIVNVADFADMRQDYMVLVWDEQGVNSPLPLGIPKFSIPRAFCCPHQCETLGRHLTTLLEQRAYTITLVGNIETKEKADGVLDMVFNNQRFKHRRNDFYIKSG